MLSTISRSSSTTRTVSFSIFLSPFRYFYLTTGFCCFPQGISLDFMKMKKVPRLRDFSLLRVYLLIAL